MQTLWSAPTESTPTTKTPTTPPHQRHIDEQHRLYLPQHINANIPTRRSPRYNPTASTPNRHDNTYNSTIPHTAYDFICQNTIQHSDARSVILVSVNNITLVSKPKLKVLNLETHNSHNKINMLEVLPLIKIIVEIEIQGSACLPLADGLLLM